MFLFLTFYLADSTQSIDSIADPMTMILLIHLQLHHLKRKKLVHQMEFVVEEKLMLKQLKLQNINLHWMNY